MTEDVYVIIAGQYEREADALADYEAVHRAYEAMDAMDTYDAAVLTKDEHGKVHIVRKHEEPLRQGAAGGLLAGLALGACVALVPAVALGGALLVGGAAGAGIGALAGHIAGGLRREDLRELGDTLDAGTSGLVVVALVDAEEHVQRAATRATKTVVKPVTVDPAKARADAQAHDD